MKFIKQSQEFKALTLKISEDAEFSHIIYFKEHSVREQSQDRPPGRTLFVVNVPPYVDEIGLSNAFKEAGTIESVRFFLKPSKSEVESLGIFTQHTYKLSFKIAYIVFNKVSELDKALKIRHLAPLNSNNHQLQCGLRKWIQEHNNLVMPSVALKEQIEGLMKAYDNKIKEAEIKEKELEQEDNEGWVTVTKKGKVQSFARTEKMENKITEKEELGKKRKELKNFYTFQIRESKMKHIVGLRQKFEEDKKKIAQIKQSRRFKPF